MKKTIIALVSLPLLCACNMKENVLLTESPLPYGAPQFDRISDSDYMPAFRQAIAEGKKEIDLIASNPESPTFENTIAALAYAGSAFDKVAEIFYNILEADYSVCVSILIKLPG